MPQDLSAEQFRAEFPSLSDVTHLASCSQGALSTSLTSELFEFQHSIRADGAPWATWIEKVEEARSRFASLIGARVEQVAIIPSASAGAYQVASTQGWAAGSSLVTTDMEFPSVAQVWLAQRSRGVEVKFVVDHDGVVDVEDYAAHIDGRSALVSVPLISYRNGLRFPVKSICELAHAEGAKVFVDAYQGMGVELVDVDDLGCDYLVSGALKYMLGISGIAFLYVRSNDDDLPPAMTGWFGQRDPFEFDPRHLEPALDARRFESGTPSIPSAYGAVAGLSLLETVDPIRVKVHVSELTRLLNDYLIDDGELLRSPSADELRGPQVALFDEAPLALDRFLKERGVVASPRGDVVRLSLHYYNNSDDVAKVIEAIAEYRRIG